MHPVRKQLLLDSLDRDRRPLLWAAGGFRAKHNFLILTHPK